jgi:hypothetical protein
MSSDGITRRNKVNAQRSTGPKSERGKAVVAQNARRHGVTSKLDPTSVAAWLRIILDKRDLVPGDLMRDDRRTTWALALAEAEVRLCTSREALDQFERGDAPLSETARELQLSAKDIADALQTEDMTVRLHSTGLSLLRRITKDITAETGRGGKRHRLLQRYAREARGQRNRAFKAWIQCLNYGEAARVRAA